MRGCWPCWGETVRVMWMCDQRWGALRRTVRNRRDVWESMVGRSCGAVFSSSAVGIGACGFAPALPLLLRVPLPVGKGPFGTGVYPELEFEGEWWYECLENMGQRGQLGSSMGKELAIARRNMSSSSSFGSVSM